MRTGVGERKTPGSPRQDSRKPILAIALAGWLSVSFGWRKRKRPKELGPLDAPALFPAAALDSLRQHLDLENSPATNNVQRLHILTGEGKVLRSSRRRNGAQIRALRSEDLNFPGGRRIQPTLSIDGETVSSSHNPPVGHGQAFILGEVAAIGQRAVVLHIKCEHIPGAAIV